MQPKIGRKAILNGLKMAKIKVEVQRDELIKEMNVS